MKKKYENKSIKQKSFQSTSQKAIVNLFLASQALRNKLEKLCAEFDITLPQFNILRILKGVYPSGHPRSEIRKRMIDKSDVTRLIDRLIKSKLVVRGQSKEDKRQSLTYITPQGMQLLEKLNPNFEILHKEIITPFSEQELELLATFLERIK